MTVVDADMTVERIVSGGQTRADSAALGFAVARGIPHGGWGPKGRRTEDGVIPDRYLLREKPGREYRQRTEWNVRDSDATVIFTVSQEVTGGSKLTAELAAKHGKPWLHLAREVPGDPVARLREFLAAHSVKVLNVAGSRASMAVPGEALSMPSHQRARSTAGWLHAAVSQAWLRSCALHSP